MNIEDVKSKIDVIQDNLDKLEKLSEYSYDEFVSDFRNIDSAEHRLQTSIQPLLDIGSYIVSSSGLRTPSTNAEIIETLAEAGLISSDKQDSYIEMARFRNRIVHLYNDIDLPILHSILEKSLDDIRSLYQELLRIIKAESKNS